MRIYEPYIKMVIDEGVQKFIKGSEIDVLIQFRGLIIGLNYKFQ